MSTKFSSQLLAWYDQHQRHLPWRARPGETPNPYYVWLSEIMLQQTTVVTVGPYFNHFIELWPTVQAMANAELDDILHAWQGLGYYARARNLHKCAKEIVATYHGAFPRDYATLLKLPGIGPYTAAAISSIAFAIPAPVMDGNIERIMARLYRYPKPLRDGKKDLYGYIEALTPEKRPGDFAQALMDIGARVCTPKNPKCDQCPLQAFCQSVQHNVVAQFPVLPPKKVLPQKKGYVYWVLDQEGRVLIQRRPEKGLLGGLMAFPTSAWEMDLPPSLQPALNDIKVCHLTKKIIHHTFTHFKLSLSLVTCHVNAVSNLDENYMWVDPQHLGEHALPTLMRKVEKVALQLNEQKD